MEKFDTDKEHKEPVANYWMCLVIMAAGITWLGSQINLLVMIGGFILLLIFGIPFVKNSRK